MTALDDARGFAWKLHAAALGVEYPTFGAVSVETTGLPAPAVLEHSLPAALEPDAIVAAAIVLSQVLFRAEHTARRRGPGADRVDCTAWDDWVTTGWA